MSEDNQKKEKLHITIDDKAMQIMADTNAQLKQEIESLREQVDEGKEARERLALLAEKEIEKKLNSHPELSAEQRQEFAENPEKLRAYELGKESRNGPATGSAPMNDAQLGIQKNSDLLTQKFNSTREMIAELRRREKSVDPHTAQEAKMVLNQFFKKCLESQRSNGQPINLYDSNDPQNLPQLREEAGFKTPVDPTEGDLGEFKKTLKQKRVEKGESE